ncbi:MAG: PEP-CTERM sorting domain-containing protein [Chromatiales bacterium]
MTATFNTFNLQPDGFIMDLGLGEGSSQNAMFSTMFDVGPMGTGVPFSLMVNITGPGTNIMLTNEALADVVNNVCEPNADEYHCMYEQMLTFEPGQMIYPGDMFTANGEILFEGASLGPPVTASDSFVARAAVPAPSALALMAIGLFGFGFSRRRKAH